MLDQLGHSGARVYGNSSDFGLIRLLFWGFWPNWNVMEWYEGVIGAIFLEENPCTDRNDKHRQQQGNLDSASPTDLGTFSFSFAMLRHEPSGSYLGLKGPYFSAIPGMCICVYTEKAKRDMDTHTHRDLCAHIQSNYEVHNPSPASASHLEPTYGMRSN